MKKNILRIMLILLLLGTFYIIFGFSSQDGEKSGSISRRITEKIATLIPQIQEKSKLEKENIMNTMENIIRKMAHFSIYTVVGLLLMSLVSTYNIKEKNRLIITLTTGIIYASSDEIHQSFVPGRSPMITDVVIDTMGVILGILLIILGKKIIKKYRENKQNMALD